MRRENKDADILVKLRDDINRAREPGDRLPFLDPDPHQSAGPSLQSEFAKLRNKTFDESKIPDTLAHVFYELIVGTPKEQQTRQGKLLETIYDLNTDTVREVYERIPVPPIKIIDQITQAYPTNKVFEKDMVSDLCFILETIKRILEDRYASTYFEQNCPGLERKTRSELFEIAVDIEKTLDVIKDREYSISSNNVEIFPPDQETIRRITEAKKIMVPIKNEFTGRAMNLLRNPILFVMAKVSLWKEPTPDKLVSPASKAEVRHDAASNLANEARKKAGALPGDDTANVVDAQQKADGPKLGH